MTTAVPTVPLRAATYVRVATVAQGDEKHRVEEQAAACQTLAGSLGVTVIAEYRDVGASGEQPSLQAMLDAASRGGVDAVLCERPDRLARGVVQLHEVEEGLARLGVTVHYAVGDRPERRALTAALASLEALTHSARKAR